MMTLYPKLILDALATVRYPGTGKNLVEAAFYEYLTGVLTQEEAAAFAAALNKLYTASKTESRAGFPHFRNTAGGETARGTTD